MLTALKSNSVYCKYSSLNIAAYFGCGTLTICNGVTTYTTYMGTVLSLILIFSLWKWNLWLLIEALQFAWQNLLDCPEMIALSLSSKDPTCQCVAYKKTCKWQRLNTFKVVYCLSKWLTGLEDRYWVEKNAKDISYFTVPWKLLS